MARLFQKLIYTRQFDTANTLSIVVPTLLTDLELSIQVAPIKLPQSWKRAGSLHRFVGNPIDKTFLESWLLGFNKQVIRFPSVNMPYQLVFESANWLGLTNLSIWRFSMPLYTDPSGVLISSTTTPTTVAASTTSVVILAANANRKGGTIWNNSTGTLSLEFGATAVAATAAVKLAAGALYEIPFDYVGVIAGIWSNTNGNAQVREFV